MGNNKQALMLIIERLGDVQRAIDFAKEQKDEDLWEDLLSYSESRPGELAPAFWWAVSTKLIPQTSSEPCWNMWDQKSTRSGSSGGSGMVWKYPVSSRP
jgi:hypothetical protein